MEIKLYNTLTNKKEIFKPIEEGHVKIYTCGVTVYDHCHLGHARGSINFDVLRNVFKAVGYSVTYVKNYTDIDDKMITRANERGITVAELAAENIKSHDDDMASLGVIPPDIAPRATEYVEEIINLTRNLIEKDFAYEVNGTVFFRVRRFNEYGKLSGKNIDDLQSGIRVDVNDDKEDALDFALWKAAKPGEPKWESPWGDGRPGWHIECSAMSEKHLGETFDIHAGGTDLIFPHHENEIAQSECAHGKAYVNYWMHNGMIKIEGQKMSKSLGNFATISDLVSQYHPELIRFFILSTQYRQSLDFSHDALKASLEGLDRIYGALERIETDRGGSVVITDSVGDPEILAYKTRFLEAMCDDMNSPMAISVIFDLTRAMNSTSLDDAKIDAMYHQLLELGSILGVLKTSAITWFKSSRIKNDSTELSDSEIDALIEKRIQAREEKNWAIADAIRDQLQDAAIQLEDRDGKTFWRRN